MEDVFRAIGEVIGGQSQDPTPCPYWDEWYPVLNWANMARFSFRAEAIHTIRQPPSPEGESDGMEE